MIAYQILAEYFWEFRTKIAIDACGNVANMPYRSFGGLNNNFTTLIV